MPAEREDLHRRLLAEIAAGTCSFEHEALAVFRFQFAHNAPYRAYAEALGRTPDRVRDWTGIPPVPTEAFKSDLPLVCFPLEEATRTFLTSGTSGEVRGRHHVCDLQLYETAVTAGWRHTGLPSPPNAWFAAPPPEHTPESSLAHMFGTLAPDGNPSRWLAEAGGRIDPAPLRASESPLVLLGTTLALLHLSETSEPLPLPRGSRVFHTGGFKGVRRDTDPAAVTDRLCTHFGVDPAALIQEYGMTELSSQAYALGDGEPFHCPPWLRVQVIDPATGSPVGPGETGYLVLYDLANLDSVLAIRTRDFATAIDDASFHLLGRDPEALPRGCSRASEAFFQSGP